MPAIIAATQNSPVVGIDGKLFWARNPANQTQTWADGDPREFPIPAGVGFRNERASTSLYKGDLYLAGGLSMNSRITKRFNLVIQGIIAPSNEIVNAAGAGSQVGFRATGSGLTGIMIPYISWWDDLTQERSPLSEAGPSVNFANKAALWDNLPTDPPEQQYTAPGQTTANATTTINGVGTNWTFFIRIGDRVALSSNLAVYTRVLAVTDTQLTVATAIGNGTTQQVLVRRNPRATHIELWRSVDGSLPRFVDRFEIGTTTITEATAVGDLGEAFTEDFEQFPRCKFNVIWNDRQVMAGDEENPSRVYVSLVGLPERKSLTIDLVTRNGEPVVGLGVVRSTLIIFGPTSSYVVNGYTEDDISMDLAQPQIGLVSHFSLQNIHGNLWIPTNLGPFVCDGSSWIPMNEDIKFSWVNDYQNRPEVYENSFAIHDPIRHVYKIYLGLHPLTNLEGYDIKYTWLVLDITPCIPQEGGSLGQPNFSFDTAPINYDSAFLLAPAGARRSDLFMGACNGSVYRANVGRGVEVSDGLDSNDNPIMRSCLIVTPADTYGDIGGNFAEGKNFKRLDLFLQNEDAQCGLELYPGDEYAYPVYGDLEIVGPAYSELIPPGEEIIVKDNVDVTMAPRTVFNVPTLNGITGRALTIAIRQAPAGDLRYRGYQATWVKGSAPRRPVFTPQQET